MNLVLKWENAVLQLKKFVFYYKIQVVKKDKNN